MASTTDLGEARDMTVISEQPAGPAGAPAQHPLLAPPSRFSLFMTNLWLRSPRWLAPAAIATCFGGAAGYVLAVDPTDGGADAVPACLVRLTTGFDCPGCGGTRAFYYLIQGNIPAASRHHALFVFAVPFLLYMYASWTARLVWRKELPQLRIGPKVIPIFLAIWFVFTVLRNLPWAPFTWFWV
jgi:hypothetical protein